MELLTVKEVADLKGCSKQNILKLIVQQKMEYQQAVTCTNCKQFFIPLAALEPPLQVKYYKQHKAKLPPCLAKANKDTPPARVKHLEEFTALEREDIELWITILDDWKTFRAIGNYASKADADKAFVAQCRERYGEELVISVDILYRRQSAWRSGDLDGLVDKRGKWKKGMSDVPTEIKDLFLYAFLDKHGLSIKKCMEATELMIKQEHPELLANLPAYATFYRWANDYPKPLATFARVGEKAFNDAYGYYVDRLYEDMVSNDYWIADGHTIDVITKAEDGSDTQHRLTLSAFIDARSGIYVGWVVTDNPSSDATLLALRKAIRRYGIPRYIYVDNGREYLNIDIGGMGHRARKRKVEIKLPTPILTHLGITMTNALPRNAQAKTIEREFRNFTFLSQLMDTYCGSNVVADTVLFELRARMTIAALSPPPTRKAKQHIITPNGMTEGQQRKVWHQMYQLAGLDVKRSKTSLGERLCGIIKRQLNIDGTPEKPMQWLNFHQGGQLIEILKKYISSAEQKRMRGGAG